MSIIVIVLGIAYGAYAAATQSVERCSGRMTLEQEARATLHLMARELRCSHLAEPSAPPVRAAGPLGTSSARKVASPVFRGGSKTPGGVFLRFTTLGGLADPDVTSSGICNVSYRYAPSRGLLLRKQEDPLYAAAKNPDRAAWLCMARNVRSVTVQYFNGRDWLDKWDLGPSAGLPRAVRVELTLENSRGRIATFSSAAHIAQADMDEIADGFRPAGRGEGAP